ncbi:hypothetical protein F5Y16DRAFT_278756 [Xylariaceae sp. FL0255]|nr:hypothetical protein F5Y16DRAFT_278756 [Xylariaceae sp. FL0255]
MFHPAFDTGDPFELPIKLPKPPFAADEKRQYPTSYPPWTVCISTTSEFTLTSWTTVVTSGTTTTTLTTTSIATGEITISAIPTPPAAPLESSPTNSSTSLSDGQVAGIVIGAVAFIGLLALLLYLFLTRGDGQSRFNVWRYCKASRIVEVDRPASVPVPTAQKRLRASVQAKERRKQEHAREKGTGPTAPTPSFVTSKHAERRKARQEERMKRASVQNGGGEAGQRTSRPHSSRTKTG